MIKLQNGSCVIVNMKSCLMSTWKIKNIIYISFMLHAKKSLSLQRHPINVSGLHGISI